MASARIPSSTTPSVDPAVAPDDARVDSGRNGVTVVPRLHLRIKTPTEDDLRKVEELRAALRHTHFWALPPHREWLTDRTLLRFLIAREFNVDKTLEMLHTALTWRGSREPYTLRATMEEMQHQGATGKIYNAGVDRWGRPVVIFNNSVNNSNDPRAQMRYLAFNLETALRKARASDANVSKFVIFMHMYDFSLWNSPPLKVTRETIQIVTTCYPETMGHCVIYQPPYVFSAFYDSVKRFIDKRTASKIVMLTGDVSEGSANDRMMRELIGDDWRVLTGVGQPRLKEGCSPGFDFDAYWPRLVAEEERLLAWEAQEAAKEMEKKKGHHHQHHHRRQGSQGQQASAGAAGAGGGAAGPASSAAPTQQQQPVARGGVHMHTAAATPVGRGPISAPQSPEDPWGGAGGAGESKLWRPKRQNSLTSIGMVAAASILSAAAAAAITHPADSSGSKGTSSALNPLALLTLLASALGFAPTADVGSGRAAPASSPFRVFPGLRWLVPQGEEERALPGEGLVVLALLLLGVSILYAYPNPAFALAGARLRGAGASGGRRPGEPRLLSPLPARPTKTIVAPGRVLAEEARRLR